MIVFRIICIVAFGLSAFYLFTALLMYLIERQPSKKFLTHKSERVLFTISIIVVLIGVFTLISRSEENLRSEGYDEGYHAAYEEYHSEAEKQREAGYEEGYRAGYEDGNKDGYEKGCTDSRRETYEDGYNRGYNDALADEPYRQNDNS